MLKMKSAYLLTLNMSFEKHFPDVCCIRSCVNPLKSFTLSDDFESVCYFFPSPPFTLLCSFLLALISKVKMIVIKYVIPRVG